MESAASAFKDNLLNKAVDDFNHLYSEKMSKIEESKKDKLRNIVFEDVIAILYERYKYNLGYMNNLPGFRGAIMRKKSELKKTQRKETNPKAETLKTIKRVKAIQLNLF